MLATGAAILSLRLWPAQAERSCLSIGPFSHCLLVQLLLSAANSQRPAIAWCVDRVDGGRHRRH